MPAKKIDTVKLNLRLPKALHRRLVQYAKRDNVSLNTEILNQLADYGSVKAQAEKVAADSHTLKLALEILTKTFGKPGPTNDAELDERMRAIDAVRFIFGGVGDPAEVELGLPSLTIRTGTARKSEQAPVSPDRGLTPERIQQIKNLVERGTSREQIAELMGVTVGSLQVFCSTLGVSLRPPNVKQIADDPVSQSRADVTTIGRDILDRLQNVPTMAPEERDFLANLAHRLLIGPVPVEPTARQPPSDEQPHVVEIARRSFRQWEARKSEKAPEDK